MGVGRPEGNPGNKGGGRKSYRDETVITAVINKAWAWLSEKWERFDDKQKMEVATKICPKTIPEIKEHTGEVKFYIIDKVNGDNYTATIQSDGQAEVSSGSVEQSGEVQGTDNTPQSGQDGAGS